MNTQVTMGWQYAGSMLQVPPFGTGFPLFFNGSSFRRSRTGLRQCSIGREREGKTEAMKWLRKSTIPQGGSR